MPDWKVSSVGERADEIPWMIKAKLKAKIASVADNIVFFTTLRCFLSELTKNRKI